jgi:type II secretory pathway pseudopilin PulG
MPLTPLDLPSTDATAITPIAATTPTKSKLWRKLRGLTLVEAMVTMSILGLFMMGFITSFIHSRRVTEASVLHAAATSVIYGIIEQLKALDYTNGLPYNGDTDTSNDPDTDPTDPSNTLPPFVRVRINQSTVKWLRVVYTQAPTAPAAPTTTPAATATAASVGAIDNATGPLPLSSVTGTASQDINLTIWVWIDEIPDTHVSELKRVTIVYTYSYQEGRNTRTLRNREVFLRSRYDQ